AIATGSELQLIFGRDRKLSQDAVTQASVPGARKASRKFLSSIRSLALGDFAGTGGTGVALLTDDGAIHLLSGSETSQGAKSGTQVGLKDWADTIVDSGAYGDAPTLTRALV